MALPDQIELLKLFQSFLFEVGLSAVSVKNYLSDLRHFLSFCASPTLHSSSLRGGNPTWQSHSTQSLITTKDIFHHIDRFLDPYLDHQKASFTPASTTARRLASIRRFSTFLSVKFNITNIFTAQTASEHSYSRHREVLRGDPENPGLPRHFVPRNDAGEGFSLSPTPPLSSAKLLEQFKTSLEREKKSHSTVKNYLSDLNHFFLWTANETPFTDQNLVNILSLHLLQSYVTYLKLCHTSTSVINRRQSSIKKLTKFCFEEGYLPENPFELKSVPQTLAPLAWMERFTHKKAKEPTGPKGTLAIIYEKYSSLRWTPYFNLALLVLATTAMAIFAYNQIINQARPSAAATSLTPPKRQLSFQGRLTDSGGTPITTAVSVVFKLFNALTGPTELYTTGTCSITPDQDGIFNTLIGDTVCGAEINSTVFTDNRDVYLEITVGAETLTPRQQIATVGYALNSETLQGYPASAAATINTVPVIDNSGNINISVNSPSIISNSGTFTVQGQVLSLKTATNSGGDIILQPDAIGSGQILALGGTTTEDTFRITNANLTTGALLSGYVGNDLVQGRLISLTSGSTETDRFWVATDGRAYLNTNATDSAFIVNQSGTGDLFSASASGVAKFTLNNAGIISLLDGVAHTIDDVAGNLTLTSNSTAVSIADDLYLSSGLSTYSTAVSDGTVEATKFCTGDGETNCVTDFSAIGGGSSVWSDLTVPTGNLTLAMDADTTTFNWDTLTTGTGWTGASTSLSSGTLESLSVNSTAATGNTQKVLSLSTAGVNAASTQTTYGLYTTNTHTGTASTNVGGYFSASGGTNNYAAIFENGNVGIGTTTPDAPLDVVGDVYISDGLSLYETTVSDGTVEATQFCTGDGETNCVTDFSTFSTGTNYWTRSAGNISPLTLNDTISATTSASVALTLTQTGAFDAFLVQDEAGDTTPFVIDQSGNVGIGTTGPDAKLDSLATTEQLRLTYTDGTVYSAHTVDSSGNLTINNTGTKTIIADDLQITGGDILDSNGNESIRFGTTASAVNEATLTNAATAGTVLFAATGGDTDIALSIDSKGADALNLNGTATGDVNIAGGSGSTGCTVANSTGNLTCAGVISGSGITASALKWNALTVPDGNLTLAMDADTTTFNWDTLTSGTGLTLAANTTGAASNTQKILSLSTAGANAASTQTTYGLYATNTHTGTASTNVGGYFSASGATNNYGLIVANGNVGIGTTAPDAMLTLLDGSIKISGTGAQGINFTRGGTARALINTDSNDLLIQANNNSNIRIYDDSSNGIYLKDGGNVGIGTTSPTAKLHVDGAVTGKALVIFNETGDQNIFTASQSGIPVFNLARVAGTAANGTTFTGSATGNGVTEAATGSDTDIAFSLDAKGAGALNLNGTATGDVNIAGGSGSTGCTIANATGDITCTGTISGSGITASALKWNALTVPDGNLTLAMDADTTTFNWDTLTTGTGWTGASTSLSSGTLESLSVNSTAATGNTQKVLSLSTAGANATSTQTTYGLYTTNTHTGTASTNVGGYFSASGGTNNYAAIFENGSVGVGITAPAATALLDLTSTTQGFLAPRMDTTQRDAISTPATGLMIYNTDTNQYNVFNGTTWGAVGGGGGAWSDLTVPTANLSLAHAGYTTAFTFDSVTTADAFALSSSSLTTGTVLDLSSTSTAGGVSGLSKVLDITRSGANANASHTAYGLYSAVTNTGTTSTNVGGYFSASGATNNYAAIFENGSVGIGTTAPGYELDVAGDVNITGSYLVNGSPLSASNWQRTSLSLAPAIITDSVNLGATATSSALIHLSGSSIDNQSFFMNPLGIGFNSVTTPIADALAVLETEGHILPHSDLTYSLGSSTQTWTGLYVNQIADDSGTVTIDVLNNELDNGDWKVVSKLRIGSTVAPTFNLDVTGTATVSGTLGTESTLYVKGDSNLAGNVTIGGGAGKLDVGTVDPPYTINGEKYATYLSSTIGIKEEVMGKITVSEEIVGLGYRALIDLDAQPKGSDLWLFNKTTDLKTNIGRLSVLLTAAGQAKTWYEVDELNKILAIYSSTPVDVTYRLTAPRFDSAKWTNTRTGSAVGFVLNDPDNGTNTAGTGLLSSLVVAPELIAKADGTYGVSINGRETKEISSFFQSIIANLKVGTQVVVNLVADNLTVRTKLISPYADIDQLKVIDATISGTLYADNIKGKTVDKLTTELNLLSEKYSTASAILADLQAKYASYDSLLADPLALSPLATTSATLPSDLILDSLLVNGSLFAQSFSSFDSDLYIQPTGDKPVHLLANLMTLYPDGKVVINGDLLITGVIYAAGLDTRTATVSGTLAAGGLVIASGNNDPSATVSAQTSTNATIGTATIASGSAEIAIANNKVTGETLIYLTPISDTSNQVLYVKSKQAGVGFTVAMPAPNVANGEVVPTTQPISFNYWLVETK